MKPTYKILSEKLAVDERWGLAYVWLTRRSVAMLNLDLKGHHSSYQDHKQS